jgi:hypothetical protein
MQIADVKDIVPGGIKATDHVHRETNDNRCSRCNTPIADDEVPLLLWGDDGRNMLIYCEACTGAKP